ncbi:hypothetical protein NQ315_016921 [Exocentrus adspersus]|uniref:Uncharacterized protein n=1 Tax=Exocentrus adspersus TaxID=1586481 RepID=A0AAV8VZH8_9CUCU|nr:hypothetical protein NQ315_016921 [Exocentrus adspersus]
MDIKIDDAIVRDETQFAVFSYKNKLYLKGKRLVEFVVTDDEITVASVKDLAFFNKEPKLCTNMQVVLCDNVIYTLYACEYEIQPGHCLEAYNLDTDEINYIFENNALDKRVTKIDGDNYVIHSSDMQLFSFQHPSLVETDTLVNESFV